MLDSQRAFEQLLVVDGVQQLSLRVLLSYLMVLLSSCSRAGSATLSIAILTQFKGDPASLSTRSGQRRRCLASTIERPFPAVSPRRIQKLACQRVRSAIPPQASLSIFVCAAQLTLLVSNPQPSFSPFSTRSSISYHGLILIIQGHSQDRINITNSLSLIRSLPALTTHRTTSPSVLAKRSFSPSSRARNRNDDLADHSHVAKGSSRCSAARAGT